MFILTSNYIYFIECVHRGVKANCDHCILKELWRWLLSWYNWIIVSESDSYLSVQVAESGLVLAFNLVNSPSELSGTAQVLKVEYMVKGFASL